MNSEIRLDFRKIRFAACIYIALPLLAFFAGFLKWYYALLGIAALLLVLYKTVRSDNAALDRHYTVTLTRKRIGLIFIFTLIWTYFGGLNGFFYQSSDWNCRNAIFHDLIQFDWPVIYESSGAALVYYIGHWLPPALIGKAVLAVSGSMDAAWLLGKMAFWLWSCVGLTIVILLIIHYTKAESPKKCIAAILLFVGFSGMDVVGAFLKHNLSYVFSPDVLHLEWWDYHQFSSITTCVYWVFNQTIIPWIITLCFLMEDDPRNYVFYCVACLLCGPFPCIGLAILMIVKAACCGVMQIKAHQGILWLRRVLSAQNIVSLCCMFPFVAAFLLANNAVGQIDSTGASEGIALIPFPFFSREFWTKSLIAFLMLDVGFYMFFLFLAHRKDPIFYAMAFTFLIAPYFRIGVTNDFCMRTPVPAILVLMLYVNDFLQKNFSCREILSSIKARTWNIRQICAVMLLTCFLFGTATPAVEVYRGVYHVVQNRTVLLEDMSIGSFDNGKVYLNFNADNPENKFFFRYFAK